MNKLQKTIALIEKIADTKNHQEREELETQLRELTGKTDINAEELARSFLMPPPERTGLNDAELTEIIQKICRAEYGEAETDYYLKLLECETGLLNISDYIFWPETVSLLPDATIPEITARILRDSQNKPRC